MALLHGDSFGSEHALQMHIVLLRPAGRKWHTFANLGMLDFVLCRTSVSCLPRCISVCQDVITRKDCLQCLVIELAHDDWIPSPIKRSNSFTNRRMEVRYSHRVIILLQRACLHNRIGRNWCKFSRPECATSHRDVTRVCELIG